MLNQRVFAMRVLAVMGLLAVVALMPGCGGCGGDPGQSVFGVSCDGSGGGSAPGATFASGSGPDTLRVPSGVTQMSVDATSATSANFAVRVAGSLIINEVIGPRETPSSFSGTYVVTPGALIEVVSATGVDWRMSAASADQSGPQKMNRSGSGDAVFVLPARSARYTITGASSAGTRNFAVRVGGRLVVNEIVGPSGWSGTFIFQSQERVEIVDASGVQWSFVEVD